MTERETSQKDMNTRTKAETQKKISNIWIYNNIWKHSATFGFTATFEYLQQHSDLSFLIIVGATGGSSLLEGSSLLLKCEVPTSA